MSDVDVRLLENLCTKKQAFVIALVGGILAVLFAFDSLGQYLMAGQDYLGLTILLPLAAA